MEQVLEQFRTSELVGVKALVKAAGEIIAEINTPPREGKIVEPPIERTVHYYISEGLLKPKEKRGHSSLFKYPDLLTLVLLRWFQAWGIPISAIQEAIGKMSVQQMEKAFGQRVMVFTDPAQLSSFVATNGTEEEEDTVVIENPQALDEYRSTSQDRDSPPVNEATQYLQELSTSSRPRFAMSRRAAASESVGRQRTDKLDSGETKLWRHIKMADGLEVHIENNFKTPVTEEDRQALIKKIEMALAAQRD